ncbi:hypothetical protein MIND_00201000 [Mycena indigotica]|uniref:F-box domain-containing protein n=1 Tax=Mycena indigotica TaxID=2126181 RepID=A0A8H6WEI8_9AGAR|nr:uncharacterized protein MIND_00201000 [Mycena indigotica]KAF7311898.1 hypothetical protein MIND_00201000 [Mycena indigotica]
MDSHLRISNPHLAESGFDGPAMQQSSSIATLPTELLVAVLDQCPDIVPDGPDFQSAHFLAYARLAQVCRRWRDVLLDRPQYWSHVVLSKPRWAEEMLLRSKTAPLTVGLNFGASSPESATARTMLFERFDRVKEIRIKRALYSGDPPVFSQPAPMLERLYIRISTGYIYHFRDNVFAGGEAPRLRHLSLDNCVLPKECRALWRGLTSLELTRIAHKANALIHELLGFLRDNAPRLRVLTLNKVVENRHSDLTARESAKRNPIRLEELEELTLRPGNWACTTFLQCAVLPKMRRLVLEICPGDPDERGIWEVLDGVGPGSRICSLELRDTVLPGEDDQIAFEMRLHATELETSVPVFTIRFVPTTVQDRREHWREKLISAMLTHSLPPEHGQLTALTIACNDLDWAVAGLLRQHSIRNIIFYRSPSTFLSALAAHSSLQPNSDQPPLSGLLRLAFVGIVFAHARASKTHHTPVFLDWLSHRLDEHKLEQLNFDYCTSDNGAPYPPADARPALAELVGRLVVLEN